MQRAIERIHGQQSLDFFFSRKTENAFKNNNNNKHSVLDAEGKIPKPTDNQPPILPEINGSVISLSDFEFEPSSSIDDDSPVPNESEQNDGEFNDESNSDDFDSGDSDASSPKIDRTKSRPTIMTRHHLTEEPKIIDDIFTPAWAMEKPVEENKVDGTINYDFNTICNVHFQLEVLEKRIQNGDDEVHEHPAMCVQVLDEEGLNDITEDEMQYRQTYKVRKVRKIKPSFWEPRCYDDEYATLTRNDDRRLREAIRETDYNNNCLSKKLPEVIEWEPEDDLIPCKKDHQCLLKLPSLKANQNSAPFEFKSFVTNPKVEVKDEVKTNPIQEKEYVKEPVFNDIPIRPKTITDNSALFIEKKKQINKAIKKPLSQKMKFESSSSEEFRPEEEIANIPNKTIQPMRILRFSSLLFDTDDEDTDCEDF